MVDQRRRRRRQRAEPRRPQRRPPPAAALRRHSPDQHPLTAGRSDCTGRRGACRQQLRWAPHRRTTADATQRDPGGGEAPAAAAADGRSGGRHGQPGINQRGRGRVEGLEQRRLRQLGGAICRGQPVCA